MRSTALLRKTLLTLLGLSLALTDGMQAAVVVNIAGAEGESQIEGFNGSIVADSFSFGIDRDALVITDPEAKSAIGAGEMQVMRFSARFDRSSSILARAGLAGTSLRSAAIQVLTVPSGGKPIPFMLLHVEPAWIKAYTVSGEAGDSVPRVEVEIWYAKVTFQNAVPDRGNVT